MANFKKLAVLCLSFLTTMSLAVFSACNTGSSESSSEADNSTSIESSIPDADESDPDESDPDESDPDDSEEDSTSDEEDTADLCDCENWGPWEVILEPTCMEDGKAQRICQTNPEHVDTETIAARDHDYTYGNGFCKCGDGPIYPADDASIVYINPREASSGIQGNGTEYDRYELTEGYYQIQTGRGTSGVWLSFSVPCAGQYALYTIGGNSTGAKISRHDASAAYIPIDLNGKYLGKYATELEDGNLYSVVNCGEAYYSTEWRATYFVEGANANLKIRFTYIHEPAWIRGYVHENVYATEINGIGGGLERPENAVPTEVPYTSEYYYEEETGFYRMRTADGSNPYIYAAITKAATRLLTDKALTQIAYELWGNLSVGDGYYYTGDLLVKDYHAMIMNDEEQGGTPGNSYQDFVNVDGMYPVNKELFKFLNLFAAKNVKPIVWDETAPEENMWLAGCYYYAYLTPGTQEYPWALSTGDNTVSIDRFGYTYCNYKPAGIGAGENNIYVLSCNTENVQLNIGSAVYTAPFSVYVEGTSSGVNFSINGVGGAAVENVVLNVASCSGSDGTFNDTTIELPAADSDGNVTLAVNKIYSTATTKYYAFYYMLVTEGTSFTVSSNSDAYIMFDSYIVDATAKTVTIDNGDDVTGETLSIIIYVELPETANSAAENVYDVVINII